MVYRGGGQPGNKNAEVWTEEDALKLGHALIDWLKAKNSNCYFGRFLHIENSYQATVLSKNILEYLSDKFESFKDLKKQADAIQEAKLCEYGMVKQATMPIFVLKNKHGYSDRVDHTSKGEKINQKFEVEIVK